MNNSNEKTFMQKKPNIVVGVIIYDDIGDILLVQGPKWINKWVVVGGHVEYGEPLIDTVIREVKEETNLEIVDIDFIQVQEEINSKEFLEEKHYIFLNYIAKAVNKNIITNEEISNFLWVDPNNALKLDLNSSTRDLLNAYLNKKYMIISHNLKP